jgi:hypothetical protein
LPALPGCDDIIMSATYMSWYTQFSPKAIKKANQEQMNQMAQGVINEPTQTEPPGNAAEPHVADQLESQSPDVVNDQIEQNGQEEPTQKSVKIEYYTLKK